jgi:hypothetical protein
MALEAPAHQGKLAVNPLSLLGNRYKTWRRNSGSSSGKSTPLWARETSPGVGMWPPPISPTSEMVWQGAKRPGRHQGGAVAGEAGDAVDARGLNGLGKGHRRQDGRESACQHRLACARKAEQEQIMGRTPA